MSSPVLPRIGFIGVGNMGRPMAALLAKAGHAVTVLDRDAALASAVADEIGAVAAEGPAALAAASDVVFTMLPNGKIVRDALLGEDGVARHLQPGTLVIDTSSSYPLGTQELGADLAMLGIGLVDAPVSGGVKRAVAGTLAIMAGGEPALVEQATPILQALGTVYPTGPLGSGHALKALNNYVSAAGLAAAAEALLVGQRFGLDGETITRVLNASTGRNNATENKLSQFILNGTFASGFALDLMAKDLRAAGNLATDLGVPAPHLQLSVEMWNQAEQVLSRGADHTAIYAFLKGLETKG